VNFFNVFHNSFQQKHKSLFLSVSQNLRRSAEIASREIEDENEKSFRVSFGEFFSAREKSSVEIY
jgi:hypothetical protein